ncbi:hypothetical protein OG292_16905 [Streptomyces sp. NBC_01511]|uniref:hypothetical protein n=1 Tax=Streptomyces sp. NBC_01511 TaxID=2903889 RepID=UPI003869F10B
MRDHLFSRNIRNIRRPFEPELTGKHGPRFHVPALGRAAEVRDGPLRILVRIRLQILVAFDEEHASYRSRIN